MCHINVCQDEMAEAPHESCPRPSPRLTWAVPVDVVKLAVSLEAYKSQLPQITTLRLCHRFGAGPLGSLPQEIVDHIISQAQEATKDKFRAKWTQNYLCFQGRCVRSNQFSLHAPDLDDPWDHMMTDWLFESGRDIKDFDELPEERKQEMFREYIDEEGHEHYDDYVYEDHYERLRAWPGQICRCRAKLPGSKITVNFYQLHELLQSQFGLNAMILHERMPTDLVDFLPDSTHYSEISYYTSCFLSLAVSDPTGNPTSSRLASHRNDVYLQTDNHLAYHRVVDPNQFAITRQQKTRFARTIRVLGLKPNYHLTELDSAISAKSDDKALWAICDKQIKDGPTPSTESRSIKRKLLEQYLQSKSRELSKQEWPQFMLISTSDAVSPS